MSFDRGYLETFLSGVARTRALVVGDLMLDRYVSGDVSRVSQEAPIPVLKVADEREMPGGAGTGAATGSARKDQQILRGDPGQSGDLPRCSCGPHKGAAWRKRCGKKHLDEHPVGPAAAGRETALLAPSGRAPAFLLWVDYAADCDVGTDCHKPRTNIWRFRL